MVKVDRKDGILVNCWNGEKTRPGMGYKENFKLMFYVKLYLKYI